MKLPKKRCCEITASGAQCRRYAVDGEDRCIQHGNVAHDAARAEAAADAIRLRAAELRAAYAEAQAMTVGSTWLEFAQYCAYMMSVSSASHALGWAQLYAKCLERLDVAQQRTLIIGFAASMRPPQEPRPDNGGGGG